MNFTFETDIQRGIEDVSVFGVFPSSLAAPTHFRRQTGGWEVQFAVADLAAEVRSFEPLGEWFHGEFLRLGRNNPHIINSYEDGWV